MSDPMYCLWSVHVYEYVYEYEYIYVLFPPYFEFDRTKLRSRFANAAKQLWME
jgi:hypothetical protein